MRKDSEQYINGKYLYYGFVSGSMQVLLSQKDLNDINVFPVRDKDTGTNMASTIRAVIDGIKPHKSFKTTINSIAEAALVGARGNSGVIFAQFLYGLSNETKHREDISLPEFAESVRKTIPYIYEAISNPVEGTMLTVIKDWSDFLTSKKESIHSFKEVMIESYHVLEKSLGETTQKLKVLSNYGVVDAGAKGFVVFIKGFIDFIKSTNIRHLTLEKSESVSIVHSEDFTEQEITYRYCTEAIIKNLNTDIPSLRQKLGENGDSCVVAGSVKTSHIHVHTNSPAELFYQLREFGTVSNQKVDDMLRQQEISVHRKWNIALVTDSTCDLSQEILDFYQINVVPINIHFGDNHYLDKVTMQPDQFYKLLQNEDEFPKTSQINERAFTAVYSHLASHYDAIISIHLTGAFSGTFLSSQKAAKRISKEFGKPVLSIDSKNLSGGLGLLVLKAAKSIEGGQDLSSIVGQVEKDILNTKIFVSVRDLNSMIKGGRVPKPVGRFAEKIGLNPVISMKEDGKSHLFGNTFSQSASLSKIFRHIEKKAMKKTIWNYIVMHAQNDELATLAEEKMFKLTGMKPIDRVNISPVIGMHAGDGAVAISITYKD